MRKIEIIDDVRLRFPNRDTEFNVGVEVGATSVLIAQGVPMIGRTVSVDAVDQLRPLAQHFRYLLTESVTEHGMVNITLVERSRRPTLRLVEARPSLQISSH